MTAAQAPGTILIVDDEKNIRKTMREALRSIAQSVEVARDGEEALARISEGGVDLVLLDLRLPGLGGLEVLDLIRSQWPALPVIVFTAHGTAEDATEATRRGASAFVQKPFSPEEIRELVQRTLAEAGGPAPHRNGGDQPAEHPALPFQVIVAVDDARAEQVLLRFAAAIAHQQEQGQLLVVSPIEVPPQTALEAVTELDIEPRRRQEALLEAAEEAAAELSIDIQTRALFCRSAVSSLVDLAREEKASHLVLPWKRGCSEAGPLSGKNVQAIARRAACPVTLVRPGRDTEAAPPGQRIAALVSDSPHADQAARRAWEIAQAAGVARLTLLHAREPEGFEAAHIRSEGQRLIQQVAHEVGIPADKYEGEVIIREDIRAALLDAASRFDTICMGASSRTALVEVLFGSVPDAFEKHFEGAAVLTEGAKHGAVSLLDAILERLTG